MRLKILEKLILKEIGTYYFLLDKRLKSKFGVCKKLNRNYNNIWGLPKGESLRCVNNENKNGNIIPFITIVKNMSNKITGIHV